MIDSQPDDRRVLQPDDAVAELRAIQESFTQSGRFCVLSCLCNGGLAYYFPEGMSSGDAFVLHSPSVEPDWRAVVSELREKIETGTLPAGSRLPSLAVLAEESGLSLYEVRKAIDRLKQSGHVTGWQGRGNFVSEDRFVYNLSRRTRFRVNLSSEGRNTGFHMVGKRRQAAPMPIARAFGIKAGTRIQRAEFIRLVQGRPAMLARHYYRLTIGFAGILDHIARTGSVTAALRECGVEDYFRLETTIMTRLPTAHEALLLEIPPTQPVLITTGVNVGAEDITIEVSEAVSRGDRIVLKA